MYLFYTFIFQDFLTFMNILLNLSTVLTAQCKVSRSLATGFEDGDFKDFPKVTLHCLCIYFIGVFLSGI